MSWSPFTSRLLTNSSNSSSVPPWCVLNVFFMSFNVKAPFFVFARSFQTSDSSAASFSVKWCARTFRATFLNLVAPTNLPSLFAISTWVQSGFVGASFVSQGCFKALAAVILLDGSCTRSFLIKSKQFLDTSPQSSRGKLCLFRPRFTALNISASESPPNGG